MFSSSRLRYSFIARDEKTTYHVSFVHRKKEAASEFSDLFTWNMTFAPKETRTLNVQYQIPMTMGLASTRKDENARYDLNDPLEQELLNMSMEEIVGYITSTGSSWAGNVESATFTVVTQPFERYLDVRGSVEEPIGDDEKQDEKEMRPRKSFPVRHPWWFRKVSPSGWTKVEDGIQWNYKDYKPHDAIVLSYFMTQLPRLPKEVTPFIDQFLDNLSHTDAALSGPQQLKRLLQPNVNKEQETRPVKPEATELEQLKQLILATYGKEPDDPLVRRHVARQLWYDPHKSFSIDNLTTAQKAILSQIDGRIQEAQRTRPPVKTLQPTHSTPSNSRPN